MMVGTVTVESQPGKGSTFRFVFPGVAVTELPETSARPADTGQDLAQFAPATILAADDVALNRALLAGYFEGTAHRLITATNGREALDLAEKSRPDVILMDMRMPDLDGYQTTKLLKAHPALKHIPVIAVTASSFREEEARARKACDGFIRKPFNRAELIAELRRFLKPLAPATPLTAPPPEAVAPATPSASVLAKRPELLEKLRSEESTIWPNLCRGMEMSEIEAFAHRLRDWGKEGSFLDLQAYAATLLEQVETIDIDHLPTTLQQFPALCRKLEQAVPNG
jgi:CheY-like chemotaxis protein